LTSYFSFENLEKIHPKKNHWLHYNLMYLTHTKGPISHLECFYLVNHTKVSTPWLVMKLFKKLCIKWSLYLFFGPKTHWIDNDVKLKNLLAWQELQPKNQCKKLAHKIQSKNLEPTRPLSSSSSWHCSCLHVVVDYIQVEEVAGNCFKWLLKGEVHKFNFSLTSYSCLEVQETTCY
jgi:hypothetical protein